MYKTGKNRSVNTWTHLTAKPFARLLLFDGFTLLLLKFRLYPLLLFGDADQ